MGGHSSHSPDGAAADRPGPSPAVRGRSRPARITEILAKKKALFEEFARVSDTAASAPEAYDISEAELAREVVAAERERLFANNQEPLSPDG